MRCLGQALIPLDQLEEKLWPQYKGLLKDSFFFSGWKQFLCE